MGKFSKIVISLLIVSVLAVLMWTPIEAEALKIALVLPDVITDLSWNAVAYQGLEAAVMRHVKHRAHAGFVGVVRVHDRHRKRALFAKKNLARSRQG